MQDCPDKAQERGKLWQNLSTYVEEKYPRGISELTEGEWDALCTVAHEGDLLLLYLSHNDKVLK